MNRPIRLRTDFARWSRTLPRDGVSFRATSDFADRLIGWGCGIGLILAVSALIAGVL